MSDVDANKGTELSLGALELPKLEAVVELMFLAAYADGTVSPEERAVFESHIAAGTHGMMSRSAVEAMVSAIEKALASEGREARLSVIRRRLGDARVRKAALTIAIRVLHADKVVVPREVAWLMRAATALEIDPEEANALLHEEAPPDSKVMLGGSAESPLSIQANGLDSRAEKPWLWAREETKGEARRSGGLGPRRARAVGGCKGGSGREGVGGRERGSGREGGRRARGPRRARARWRARAR